MRAFTMITILVFGSPAAAQQLKEITNSIGMRFVRINAGSFTMGSPVGERGRREDELPHEVTISKSFYLGIYEVTQDQYEKVMGNNPSQFKETENPVEKVSWDDAASFCKKISELPEEKTAGREYRLPTEAEWEYACRATSSAAYCFGDSEDDLEEYSWFNGRRGTHPVGEKKPNRWGLYDMHGNVSEWCHDGYWWIYPKGEQIDPKGPPRSSAHVARGGSYRTLAIGCRASSRSEVGYPGLGDIGFRVAMSLPAKQPESASTK